MPSATGPTPSATPENHLRNRHKHLLWFRRSKHTAYQRKAPLDLLPACSLYDRTRVWVARDVDPDVDSMIKRANADLAPDRQQGSLLPVMPVATLMTWRKPPEKSAQQRSRCRRSSPVQLTKFEQPPCSHAPTS